MTPQLSNRQARRIFLDRHRLSETPAGPSTGPALLELIESLGFVQLDSINTVARAHDLILFSRRPQYRPKHLTDLYDKGGALFEHWTHDASVIPLKFYNQWEIRRRRDAIELAGRWKKDRREGFKTQFQRVLDQIRAEGPLTSADVGKTEKRSSGGWWDWHPSKTALEYLWRRGDLFVVGRDGFKKRYDLTERVLDPQQLRPNDAPDEAATIEWCCDQALHRLGFATHTELAKFWAHITPAEAKAWCQTEVQKGALQPIEIVGADGQVKPVFARPDIREDPGLERAPTKRLRVLSPFDPALRNRDRAEHLFGFNYRIEMFVPAPKRVYGYYVFPLLEGDTLVGRVDMKAFRDQDTLRVRALWPEPKQHWGKGRQRAFEAELERIKKLAGVTQVDFDDGWLRALP